MSKVVKAFASHNSMTVNQALEVAKEQDLTEVIIMGFDSEDDLIVGSSGMLRKDALWLIEKYKFNLLHVED